MNHARIENWMKSPMRITQEQTTDLKKHGVLVSTQAQEWTPQNQPLATRVVGPQVAYRRAQVNRRRLTQADLPALQRTVGNRQVQRLLLSSEQRLRRSPAAGGGGAAVRATTTPPVPLDYSKMSQAELKTQYAVVQLMLMTSFPPLNAIAPLLQQEAEKIKQALIDKIVTDQIKSLLSQFQTISVFIPGTTQPLPPGQLGPPAPKTVTFHAAYFINTDTAKATVKTSRDTSHFGTIVKSRDESGQTSLIESGGRRYGSGTAVRVGKATPDNVRQFVQEALDNDTIRKYAFQKGKLAGNQQLSSLSDADAREVVQEWVIANGVGVDCSGFVLQAAVQARDAVRNELRGLGIPESKLPKELGHEERRAKSFDEGTKVAKPSDLRSGDAWVLNNGRHVKIVIDVRQAKNAKGDPVIEFDTAESAGDSTRFATGPTQGTKQTKSLSTFGLGGSFHRI
jgi:hypothetical protein